VKGTLLSTLSVPACAIIISRVPWVALILTVVAGCAAVPPELDLRRRDAENEVCMRSSGAPAIAACRVVLARSEPVKWPGYGGTFALAYESRGHSALALASHL
jgi:hypothetical protein